MRISFLVAFFSFLALACGKSTGPKRCYADYDCSGTKVCALLESEAQTCLEVCDREASFLCEDGSACVEFSGDVAGRFVCLPGGDTALGESCAYSVACVTGAVCVTRTPEIGGRCEKLCALDQPTSCGADAECLAFDEDPTSLRGSCVAP